MLPGLNGAALAGGGTISASLISNLGNSTSSVTFPASGLLVGDIAFFFQVSLSAIASPPGSATPSGFTLASTVTGTTDAGKGIRLIAAYKRLLGTEGGTSVSGTSGGVTSRVSMIILRVSRVPSALTLWGATSSATGGVPATLSVSASGITKSSIVCGYATAASLPAPAGTLTSAGVPVTSPVGTTTLYYDAQFSPATRTLSVGDTGNYNAVSAFGLAMDF